MQKDKEEKKDKVLTLRVSSYIHNEILRLAKEDMRSVQDETRWLLTHAIETSKSKTRKDA